MQIYKTTHETDWRRVRWVHDTDYDPVGSFAYADDKETQAAVDFELTGLQNGALVVLGALVEMKCPHCKYWQDHDSLWGIVVDSDEDLEAWGTDNLSIPEIPEAMDCADTGIKAPNDDTKPKVTERRQIPLSPEAQAYVERAAETPPETIEHLPGWLVQDMGRAYHDGLPVPPPPEGPPNTLEKEGDTKPRVLPLVSQWGAPKKPKRRLPKKVRACIEAALNRADSKLRDEGAVSGGRNCSVDPAAQEAMRLYLDTWVAGPLKEVLKWDEGKDDFWTCWD